MRLRKISLEAFRSFRDAHETQRLPDNGLCLIKGYNHDTNGSSGSGKTTLALAVAHAFRFSHFPSTELQSNLTDTKLQVSLELETEEGSPVYLNVGREQSITVNGETVKGSATAVQEKLQTLTGLSPDLMKALTYRPQKKPGLFLSMTDSEKKEFLSTLLGLEELENAYEIALQNARQAEKEVENARRSLELIQDQKSKVHIPVVEKPEKLDSEADKLSSLEKELEKKEKTLVDLRKQMSSISETISNTTKHLSDLLKVELEKKTKEQDAALASLPPFVPTLQKELEIARQKYKEATDLVKEIEKREETTKQAAWKSFSALSDKLNDIRIQEAKIPALQEERAKLLRELGTLEAARCPTCEQEWKTDAAHNHSLALKARVVEIDNKITEIETLALAKGDIESLAQEEKKIATSFVDPDKAKVIEERQKWLELGSELKSRVDREEADYNAKKKEIFDSFEKERLVLKNEFAAKQDKALEGLSEEQQEIYSRIESVQQEVNQLQGKIAESKRVIAQLAASFESDKRAYETAKQHLDSLTKKATELRTDLEKWNKTLASETHFAELVGRQGFLGAIFEEILVEISQETNELLRALPNVATTTVEFETSSETKKGTIQNRITPVVTKNGSRVSLEAGLSGGQLTSVELAVDLAVMNVIGRRTGKMPGWLILDESFEGHDVPVKEACLDILKKAAEDRLIIVVDHASEIGEMFDTVINVESQGDVSSIV